MEDHAAHVLEQSRDEQRGQVQTLFAQHEQWKAESAQSLANLSQEGSRGRGVLTACSYFRLLREMKPFLRLALHVDSSPVSLSPLSSFSAICPSSLALQFHLVSDLLSRNKTPSSLNSLALYSPLTPLDNKNKATRRPASLPVPLASTP